MVTTIRLRIRQVAAAGRVVWEAAPPLPPNQATAGGVSLIHTGMAQPYPMAEVAVVLCIRQVVRRVSVGMAAAMAAERRRAYKAQQEPISAAVALVGDTFLTLMVATAS